MTTPVPAPAIRLLLVDDHAMLRAGLRRVLSERADFSVIAEASSLGEAWQLLAEHTPDVLLMDIELKNENGLCILSRIRELYPTVRVLVLSMHNKPNYVREANAAGAHGYVLKDEDQEVLVRAVERVAAGERFHSAGLDWTELSWHRLTKRERQVAHLLANAYGNPQIAARHGVGEAAVKTQRSEIYKKLGVRSAVEIAEYIRRNGIFECEDDA